MKLTRRTLVLLAAFLVGVLIFAMAFSQTFKNMWEEASQASARLDKLSSLSGQAVDSANAVSDLSRRFGSSPEAVMSAVLAAPSAPSASASSGSVEVSTQEVPVLFATATVRVFLVKVSVSGPQDSVLSFKDEVLSQDPFIGLAEVGLAQDAGTLSGDMTFYSVEVVSAPYLSLEKQ